LRELLVKLRDVFDRRTRLKLVVATLGSVVVALLDTLAIALVLPLVDLASGASGNSAAVAFVSGLLGDPDTPTLTLILTVAVVTLFILKDVGSMAFTWWVTGFVQYERVRTSTRLLRHFLLSPYVEVSRRSSAELLRTMNESVFQFFGQTVSGLMYAVSNAISIAAIVTALAIVAPLPTLAIVLYFGLAALLYLRAIKPRASAAGTVLMEASLEGWRTAFAALGGIKELTIRGTQEYFVRKYGEASTRAAQASRTASFLGGLPKYILEILFILAVGLILLATQISSTGAGSSSVLGVLALFVAAGFRVLPSVTGLLGSLSSIKVGGNALELVHREVLSASADRAPDLHRADPLPFRDGLMLENVTFRYPQSDVDVLRQVSFSVPRGSSVALVGPSGSGKTTLVDVILGLYQPQTGRVAVDGTDIGPTGQAWQQNVAYVPQDVYALDASLAENIAFDRPREDIDPDSLARTIRQAELEDLVRELPQGIDTAIGEKGARLSGGQRQRVGIARALYRHPELLVLDEATSALDNETEHRISQTIKSLHGSITVIIVAHRLSTVRHVDQVVYLKNGRVETVGTFDEVRARNEDFARLVKLGSLEPLARPGVSEGPQDRQADRQL
jgi:ABC-type bacteriocin/lantibiotic exporter with double-glycine peptidase domain